MHPLVRDLYKRVLIVGRDYPHPRGLPYVREKWKAALRNPENCPSCYDKDLLLPNNNDNNKQCEKEIHQAVARGRHMVREMIGIIQLKKYRTMKQRYGSAEEAELKLAMEGLDGKAKNWQ